MNLGIKERLLLQQMLPKEGNFITLKVIMDLRSALGFTEEEIKEIGLEQKDGRIKWDGEKEKNIEIGSVGKDIIVTALKELDKQGKLTFDMLSLCEKFIGEKNV